MNNIIKVEKWKPLLFCNGKYAISNFGRIKSMYTMSSMCKIQVRELILKTGINKKGYEIIGLSWFENGNRIEKTKKIHRLVCEAFHPNPKNMPEVNHKDLNKKNNFYRNLEWSTPKLNTNHYYITTGKVKKPYVKRGNAECYKKIIDLNTGIFYNSKELAFVLNTQPRYINRMLSEERKPNTSQYQYC